MSSYQYLYTKTFQTQNHFSYALYSFFFVAYRLNGVFSTRAAAYEPA
jgi:hypothetical protein